MPFNQRDPKIASQQIDIECRASSDDPASVRRDGERSLDVVGYIEPCLTPDQRQRSSIRAVANHDLAARIEGDLRAIGQCDGSPLAQGGAISIGSLQIPGG